MDKDRLKELSTKCTEIATKSWITGYNATTFGDGDKIAIGMLASTLLKKMLDDQ